MSIDIQKALDIISDVPLFKRTSKISTALTRIDNKLINRCIWRHLVLVSSLINALLGEHILISSPNPYYSYYRNIYEAGSYITLKSQSQLLR